MGRVAVQAELAGARRARVRVLVDTGATYSVLPADHAKRLEITEAPRRPRVGLAGGRRKAMPVGTVFRPSAGTRRGRHGPGLSRVAQAEADASARRAAGQHPRRARVEAHSPITFTTTRFRRRPSNSA